MTDDLEKYESMAAWLKLCKRDEYSAAITKLVAMVREARAEQEEAQRNYLNVKTWWNGERESCRKLQATISAMSAEIDELTARAELVRMAAHNTRKAKALEEAEKALDNVSSRARMQDSDGAQVNVDNYHLKEARRALATIRAARGEKEDG